jgi:GntR family transcriptional regulator/MocR family aminotransferase
VTAPGWADLYAWQVDRDSATPLFRQVYAQIRSAVLSRTLPPGLKLPSTRELASRLGLARASVVSAYEQLLAEGYLAGKVGSGTYISSDLPEPIEGRAAHRRVVSPSRRARLSRRARTLQAVVESTADGDVRPFALGRCRVDDRTAEAWRALTHRAARALGPVDLGYSDPRGRLELRETICDYLQASRAVRCGPDRIVITAGTQQAIDIAIRVLLDPGDEAWIEDPCYPLTSGALAAAGVKLRPIPVDAQGLDVAAGIRAAPRARAAFVTPSHQFPLGVVLSMSRRLELLAWARERGAWIVEDDYASEFRYAGRPLAALQGLDEAERTIYVGTLNKALFPGLRLGYAVVPPAVLPAFVNARTLMDRQPATLYQSVAAEFMRQGHFAGHVRRMRLMYREQRDVLVAELGGRVRLAVPDQGMHLVAYPGDGVSDIELARNARERGVVVRPISRWYRKAPRRSGLMLGFTGFAREAIRPAAARLAEIIEHAGGTTR